MKDFLLKWQRVIWFSYLVLLVVASVFTVMQWVSLSAKQCAFFVKGPWCDGGASHYFFSERIIFLTIFFVFLALAGASSIHYAAPYKHTKLLLFCGAVLLGVGLLILPFTSSDLVYYYNVGRVATENPHLYTQQWVVSDPFNPLHASSLTTGVMYGPLAVALFQGIYKLGGGNVFYFVEMWRLFMIMAAFVVGWLLYQILRAMQITCSKFLVPWLVAQPLLWWEWVVNGHFDGLWIITVLAAFYFSLQKKWYFVFPLLVVGVWIKFIPLIVAPWFVLWWWQEKKAEKWSDILLEFFGVTVICAAVTWLSWYHFWQGFHVFGAIALQSKWAVNSVFAALYYTLEPIFMMALKEHAHLVTTALLQEGLLLLVFYFLYPLLREAVLVVQRKKEYSLYFYAKAVFLTLFIFMFVWQKSWWPWYAAWLLPFGLLMDKAKTDPVLNEMVGWLAGAPLLFYIPFCLVGGDAPFTWFYWYVVVVVMMYPFYLLYRWRQKYYGLNE